MKNRIDACFEKLKAENKKALVTFITAGDPDMDTTEKCVLEMYKNGSDIIEIGVPFSDPIAEGATIQKASLRSLSGGTNLDKIFDLVRKLRTQTDKPMLLMMYINTIFKFGTAKFFELCKETQIDGVIVLPRCTDLTRACKNDSRKVKGLFICCIFTGRYRYAFRDNH